MRKVCLLLHGFTGGPHELWPLAEALVRDGYTAIVPTLRGHNRNKCELKAARHTDWIADADRYVKLALRKADWIDLVGFSMGGLLAAYAANRHRVRRLVLISAAVIYISPRRFARELMGMIRDRNFDHFVKARGTPVSAVLEFARLARRLRPEIPRLKVPTLIVQGDQDHIVHPLSARWICSRITAPKELIMVPGARHLVLLDKQAELAIQAVRRFLNEPERIEGEAPL
mgnify:CR=1 FL=1